MVDRRRYVYDILEAGGPGDWLDRTVDVGLFTLILANIAALMAGTVPSLDAKYGTFFLWFEVVSVIIFTIEYVARVWSCTADPRYAHPVKGRGRFALKPMSLVDLFAVLPFYLAPVLLTLDLRFLRALRLLRIARIMKIARYSDGFRTLGRVFRNSAAELSASAFVVGVLAVLASSMMYFAETDAQPETFSSIPATLWWAVVTLTTVGYGDTFPITPMGRVLGAVVALLGVAMVALPAGILGSGFVQELTEKRRAKQASPQPCPHCGEDVRTEAGVANE